MHLVVEVEVELKVLNRELVSIVHHHHTRNTPITLYLHDVDSPLPVDTAAPRVFRSVGMPFAKRPPN